MTIVMNGSILSTTGNIDEAHTLLAQMRHAHDKWVREGKPYSGEFQ